MDPATAIGVASGVIAFVDFSWKLITGAKGLYDKGETQSAENVRIGKIIKDLKEFSLDLDGGSLGTSKHEKALKALATNCGDLCQELIGILEKLKAKKNSRWETLKTTWASMRKADDINDIERRLGEYRAEMNTRLLALINEQQSGLKSQLDVVQTQAETLSSSSATELKQLRADFVSLLQKLEREFDNESEVVSVSSEESSLHQELFGSLEEISRNLSRLDGLLQTTPTETRILEHLYFEGIFARLDSIENASGETFEWIVKPNSEFRTYLSTSKRLYRKDSSSETDYESDIDHESDADYASDESGSIHVPSQSLDSGLEFAMSHRKEWCMNNARNLFQDWLSGGHDHRSSAEMG
ncbi:hypothetical protein CKAH01_13552 [Colletotrichum kahawae]|uniref:Azaphilone pigments biosynthesis cluster protein L N-terminal domain-containing protein n=1 Tax=Colletotrichum kahawae TaxID=34407 RepID=A0AAD9YQN9_COLKA|nr:hypothetical protein CKAH01_13552 [Colletotrichum kahawae]